MKYLYAVLGDRRRRQRGSVLSAVLIIVAFLSIIAAAIMTELSTNFLLSQRLVDRVATEATVTSAVESTLNQLQATGLGSGCPAPTAVTLNGHTAVATYVACAPVVDVHSVPQFPEIASAPASFTIDGTHVMLPSLGRDEYLIGDLNGNLYEYTYGSATPGWSVGVDGVLTGPPAAMLDNSVFGTTILDLVPVSHPDDSGTSPNCGTRGFCVAVLQETPGSQPVLQCFMAADGKVTGRPAAGANLSSLAYFGDATGTMYAYAPGSDDNCTQNAASNPLAQPIVSGAFVFPGASGKKSTSDEIYVVASDGSGSTLVHFTYTQDKSGASLQTSDTLALPFPNATGVALEQATLPARIAVTFAGGQLAMAQVQSDFDLSLLATQAVPTTISGAPFWCHCPSGDVIGVGGNNGLYLFDTGLKSLGSYAVAGTAINTAPTADSAGDWFVGADDGSVYEIQKPGSTLTLGAKFGTLGAKVGSSATVAGCPSGLCVYVGLRNGTAFLIPLDARDVTITACLSTSPPSCSGDNPRLWARAEVGVAGKPRTVHVTGWSYYSP